MTITKNEVCIEQLNGLCHLVEGRWTFGGWWKFGEEGLYLEDILWKEESTDFQLLGDSLSSPTVENFAKDHQQSLQISQNSTNSRYKTHRTAVFNYRNLSKIIKNTGKRQRKL